MLSNCQNCGNPIAPHERVCSYCGLAVQAGQSQPLNQHNPSPVPPPPGPAPLSQTGPFPSPGSVIHQHFATLRGLLRQYPVVGRYGPLSFLSRMHCPFCDFAFHPGDCAIYWEDEQRQLILKEQVPQTELERLFARLRSKRLDQGAYFRHNAQRACPRCQSLLPSSFESYPTFTIAVIGNTVSGKSLFITALLHLLNERIMAEQGEVTVDFQPLNEKTKRTLEQNDDTLFKEKKPLDITREADGYRIVSPRQKQGTYIQWEPLIFRLKIGYKEPGKNFRDNLLNLVFYDMSGELQVTDRSLRTAWPLSHAQGIILVADPLSMPGILPYLGQGIEVQAARSMATARRVKPDQILSQIAYARVAIAGGNQQKPVSTPVAIMLSKSDLLDGFARKRGFPASFAKNPVYTGNVHVDEINQISDEVVQLLQEAGEVQLLAESKRYAQVKFFATSATGHALGQDGTYPKVEPRRCLDPLLWLLWELTGKQ